MTAQGIRLLPGRSWPACCAAAREISSHPQNGNLIDERGGSARLARRSLANIGMNGAKERCTAASVPPAADAPPCEQALWGMSCLIIPYSILARSTPHPDASAVKRFCGSAQHTPPDAESAVQDGCGIHVVLQWLAANKECGWLSTRPSMDCSSSMHDLCRPVMDHEAASRRQAGSIATKSWAV